MTSRPALVLLLLALSACAHAPAAPPPAPPAPPPTRVAGSVESWWTYGQRLADGRTTCLYGVGPLVDPPDFPAWEHPDPRPLPAAFVDAAECQRCRRTGDGGGAGSGILTFDDEPPAPDSSSRVSRAQLLSFVRRVVPDAAVSLPEDSLSLTVTTTDDGHRRLRAWLRPLLCPHPP
jgi:hypothetical protein